MQTWHVSGCKSRWASPAFGRPDGRGDKAACGLRLRCSSRRSRAGAGCATPHGRGCAATSTRVSDAVLRRRYGYGVRLLRACSPANPRTRPRAGCRAFAGVGGHQAWRDQRGSQANEGGLSLAHRLVVVNQRTPGSNGDLIPELGREWASQVHTTDRHVACARVATDANRDARVSPGGAIALGVANSDGPLPSREPFPRSAEAANQVSERAGLRVVESAQARALAGYRRRSRGRRCTPRSTASSAG